MPSNNIAFARNYTAVIDEVYQRASVSGVLNSGRRMVRAGHNAKEILIPKISVTGLGNYTRNVGYKTGAITYEFETKTFNYDRGIRLFADVMDVEEAGVNDCFVEAGAELQRTQVAPEADAYLTTRYLTRRYDPSSFSQLTSSSTPRPSSPSPACSDAPSTRVGVSLPPISTGATTTSTQSISFSRSIAPFIVPPDCTVSRSHPSSVLSHSSASLSDARSWSSTCKLPSSTPSAGCAAFDVTMASSCAFAHSHLTPSSVRCVLSKTANDTGSRSGIGASFAPIFAITRPVFIDHRSVVCSIS